MQKNPGNVRERDHSQKTPKDDDDSERRSLEVVLSCLVLSCLVLSCLVSPCLVCLVLSCLVLSRLVLFCFVLSCLVLSCVLCPLTDPYVAGIYENSYGEDL